MEEAAVELPTFVQQGASGVTTWKMSKFLAYGSHGHVYEAAHPESGEPCAVKTLKIKKNQAKIQPEEVEILQSIHHAHIVEFVDYFETPSRKVIVTRLCANGDMATLLKCRMRLKEPEARYYLKQIVAALSYLHTTCNIVHRDVKLGNLLLTHDMRVKLCDFGFATVMPEEGWLTHNCGTPNYISPEILNDRPYGFGVDVWATGVVLYALLIGRPAFETTSVDDTYRRIRGAIFYYPPHIKLHADTMDLINAILVVNPLKRPSWAHIEAHPFLTQHNVPSTLLANALIITPTFPTPNIVSHVHSQLVQIFEASHHPDEEVDDSHSQQRPPRPKCWVSQWKDVSHRYGLFYRLDSGAVGAWFNDSATFIQTNGEITYTRRQADLSGHDYQKKQRLLHHFETRLTGNPVVISTDPAPNSGDDTPTPFVRKWIKTNHAIFFRLVPPAIQVCFNDHTVLYFDWTHLTYMRNHSASDDGHSCQYFHLSPKHAWKLHQDPHLMDRLRYIRTIFDSLIAKRKSRNRKCKSGSSTPI